MSRRNILLATLNRIPAGEQVFTESTLWTAPFTGVIDVFMVNGGNGGGGGSAQGDADTYVEYSDNIYSYANGGVGGNGGNTRTLYSIPVTKGQQYSVIIGAGGNGAQAVASYDNIYKATVSQGAGGLGGTTSFGNFACTPQSENNCGSGAGRGGRSYVSYSEGNWSYYTLGSEAGATDGNNTSTRNGQGATTRDFNNVLYAGGGAGGIGSSRFTRAPRSGWQTSASASGGAGGGGNSGQNGAANTGGGGGGSNATGDGNGVSTYASVAKGGNGGSGVVIIRWNKQGR